MKACVDKISRYFNNLSLYKKILLIFSMTLLFVFIAFELGIYVLSQNYARELYTSNAQSLNYVTSFVSARMQSVESISSRILSDSVIQDNLTSMREDPRSPRNSQRRRDVYQALYPYIFDNDYIQSISLVLSNDTVICMGNTDDINAFSTDELASRATEASGQANWAVQDSPGKNVVLYQDIRQLKYLTLDHLAYLYIVVDMDQIVKDALENAGYTYSERSHFILLTENRQFYPESPYHAELYSGLLQSVNRTGNLYSILSVDGRKTFIIRGEFPDTGWNYFYFQDYDPLFSAIQKILLCVMLFSACIVMIALILDLLLLKRILRHLDLLVEKIRNFGQGLPDPEDTQHYDYRQRCDEIGQLHVSFDEMKKNVKTLKDKNYEKQLLLRDANIKMLQQQINPHFLYNTLDTINWMAQKYGADDISVMVRSLGNLFRTAVNNNEDLIPLNQEVDVLQNYIRIQQIRFGDRLDFKLRLPENISHIYVPKLCIQPLVENALKYAMEFSDDVCHIEVSLLEKDTFYQIMVANTGSQFEDNLLWKIEHKQLSPQGSGVGLVNINSRLKLLFGDRYGLSVLNENGMAIVLLSIPKEREDFYAPIDDCR